MYFQFICKLSVKNNRISTKFAVFKFSHIIIILVCQDPVLRHRGNSQSIFSIHPAWPCFVLSGSNALIHRSNTKEIDGVKILKQTSNICSLIKSGVNQFRVVELQKWWRSE